MNFWDEFKELMLKNIPIIIGTSTATLLKMKMDADKKLSRTEIGVNAVMNCLAGYLVCLWMYGIGANKYTTAAVVPVATLLGSNIIRYLVSNAIKLLDKWFTNKTKD